MGSRKSYKSDQVPLIFHPTPHLGASCESCINTLLFLLLEACALSSVWFLSFCTTILGCMLVKSLQSYSTLCDPVDCSPPGSCSWDSPGKNTRIGCDALLQGIFLTQGSNPRLLHLLHRRHILYC